MDGKVAAIVQARMSSQRFPKKVLHEVAGKPMLQYLLERLEHCSRLGPVVVATSTDESDIPLLRFCEGYGIACFRGSLNNVADRFMEAIKQFQLESFARVNGDSPLLDQRLIEMGVSVFLEGDFDIVTNVRERTYPKGQSVEILRADTFRYGYERMQGEDEFEHVTPYFYNHPEDFRIFNFALARNLNGIQLSVDTSEDMDSFEWIISRMEKDHWEYSLDEILAIHSKRGF